MPDTMLSPAQLIATAKAGIIAYNEKDWDALRASLTPDMVYDEVATGRKTEGAEAFIALCQGWQKMIPDSAATFHNEFVSGDTVVFEVEWKGTHSGPMETPTGTIPPSGKRIALRACILVQVSGERARSQTQYFDMATLLTQIGAI